MSELEKRFLQILQFAAQNKASDIHLMTGHPPAVRTSSGLTPVPTPNFTAEEMHNLINQLMATTAEQKAQLQTLHEIDGSFEARGHGRFRFNAYRTSHGLGAVLRVIAQKVPTLEELRLPDSLKKIAEAPRGLILVTGDTGCGKSSTLAALVDHLNSTRNLHIVTIEDPIEFIHSSKRSRFSQREIGRDTKSFAFALRSALRQDPDVILVGEMRDHETIDVALKAAETGHLVLSTVHTADAMKTIGRLVSLFPAEEQTNARIRLGDNLHAVISQRLMPGVGEKTVVAQEILINNLGINECIVNERKTIGIPGLIEKGRVAGMQTFDQHLLSLVNSGLITMEIALANSSNPSDMERNFHLREGAEPAAENLPKPLVKPPKPPKAA